MARTPRSARKVGTRRGPAAGSVKTRSRAASAKAGTPQGRKPLYNATFLTFLQTNPGFYIGAFGAHGNAVQAGVTLTKAVRHSMKLLASGKWATTTARQGSATVVLVAFADKSDFDKVRAHHGGKTWTSPFRGASDAFSA